MELLNFQFETPTLKGSNSTIKVGFSSPLQGKTSESNLDQTASILGWTIYEIDCYHEALYLYAQFSKIISGFWFFLILKKCSKFTTENGATRVFIRNFAEILRIFAAANQC